MYLAQFNNSVIDDHVYLYFVRELMRAAHIHRSKLASDIWNRSNRAMPIHVHLYHRFIVVTY